MNRETKPLAGDEGLNEIRSALDFLDRQTAIENLHFHKAQILNAVTEYAALKARIERLEDGGEA